MSDDIRALTEGTFLDAVERKLRAPEKRPAISPAKMKALQEWRADVEKSYGPAGSVGLGLFKQGKGVNFKVDKDGTPVAELLPDDKNSLQIDGEDVGDFETLREFLRKEELDKEAK